MAKDNIFDSTLVEIFLRMDTTASSTSAPSMDIISSIGSNNVAENYNNSSVVFTSTVGNVPTGYSVLANSHVITYPTAVSNSIGGTNVLVGAATAVILGSVGSTFTVSTACTLTNLTDPLQADILITGIIVIEAVVPMYYGVKPYSAAPDTTTLTSLASTETQTVFTSTTVGRIYIVLPTAVATLVSVTGPNGLVLVIADDFNLINVGSYNYYQLNYDTQLTGANNKTFELNYI